MQPTSVHRLLHGLACLACLDVARKALSCRVLLQALEKSAEAGSALDKYEIEGPDRAELLQDLGEFQLAAVLLPNSCRGGASARCRLP